MLSVGYVGQKTGYSSGVSGGVWITRKNPYFALKNTLPLPMKSEIKRKMKVMKRKIIYVGTLIDLAAIFEPDEEAESIEVTNILKFESYE